MIDNYIQEVNKAAIFIQKQSPIDFHPQVALTLGSGLGKLTRTIKPVTVIPYTDIPYFPQTTIPGHEGRLILGFLEKVPVLGYSGRKHYYEVSHLPDAMDQVVFPVHVAANLGCKIYIATNAAGGLNPDFAVGDLMVIKSHISYFLPNPLLGLHHNFGGNPYFQPQTNIYTPKLRELFQSVDPEIKEGIYTAVTGRTFESQADSLMLRKLGVDAVGMSTVPEIIIATNRGMETLGVSIITNKIAPDGTNATSHEEVMSILNSQHTEVKLVRIFKTFFREMKNLLQ